MVVPLGPVAGRQMTAPVSPPQHSAAVVHRLLRILQPRPGWQTFTPVSAQGPQLRLQQLPQPLQSTPSCMQVPAPLVMTSWHTPRVAPDCFEHHPPQQSTSREQASPGWMQNDEPSTQWPALHSPEQQVFAAAASPDVDAVASHGLPAVMQAVVRGWHLEPVQLWLQHSEDVVHAWLSATHAGADEQRCLVVSHCRLQQSVATAHELPRPLQIETFDLHFAVTGSHACEQHCVSAVHASPTIVHTTPLPPNPGVPASADAPVPLVPPPPPLTPLLFEQLARASTATTLKIEVFMPDIRSAIRFDT